MKKLLTLLMFTFCLTISTSVATYAQDKKDSTKEEKKEDAKPEPKKQEDVQVSDAQEEVKVADQSFNQAIKQKFIEGGWEYMTPILFCLILGLAVAIERIIVLNLSSTNTRKLTRRVEEALEKGGVEEAKTVVQNTRGPVASIFSQGLMRMGEGIDMVEKSVVAYGGVEMGRLERGLVWISLFIALAPMLGFLGTVVGMIQAFDAIEAAGDISPTLVASGIKVALITTVGGLIVAIILQLLYNYIVSKVDAVVSQMEEASIDLIDVLVAHNAKK